MPSKFKSHLWDIGRTHIHVLEYPDNGPATLFLHANGMSAGTYGPLFEHLTSRLHLVAGDLPGHGLSGPPAVNPIRKWDSFISDLQALISRHFKTPVHVVGHSLGGVVAYLAAAQYPQLINRLVMIDPPGFLPRPILWGFSLVRAVGLIGQFHLVKAARRRKYLFGSKQEAAQRYMAGKGMFKTWGKPFIQGYLDSALDFSQTPGRLRCLPETEAQIFAAMPSHTWRHASKIQCPVLLLRGQYSDTFLKKHAHQLADRIPDCRLETIPGSTHFLPMEKPDLVSTAILDHLKGGV